MLVPSGAAATIGRPHAEALEQQRGDGRGRAVRAVDEDVQAVAAARRRRRRSSPRSARRAAREAAAPPTSPPIGSSSSGSSSASTRSSSASMSLKPSPPKSLMPLSRERVVGGRDDGAEVGVLLAHQHGHAGRRQHAGPQRHAAGRGDAGAERVLEHRPRAAGVAADEHLAGARRAALAREAHGRAAEPERELGRQLGRVRDAADAVGSEQPMCVAAAAITASRTAAACGPS